MNTVAVAPHRWYDDALALASGTLFVGLGLSLFKLAGLLTGGTAGIALLASYASGLGFGPLFFTINLPFYLLAWKRMGPRCCRCWRAASRTGPPSATSTPGSPRWAVGC
jgi:uncharacterized membrane-anchored protein YitT (DUF2179 family)